MGKLRPRRGGSRAKATQEGRAGAEFTPGGKEEAGTGRMTQRARSRALGLGGRPLDALCPTGPATAGLGAAQSQPFSTLFGKHVLSQGGLLPARPLRARFSRLVLGAWGARFV